MDKITAVIKGKDQKAVFPIVSTDHCAYLLKQKFSDVIFDAQKLAEVLEYGYKLYDYDMVLVFTDPYVEAQALGCQIEFTPYPILISAQTEKRLDRTPIIIEAVKILKKKISCPIFVSIKGPFSLASFLIGINKFLRLVLTDELFVHQTINQALQFQLKYLAQLVALDVNIFLGDPVASGSVISSDIFQKYAFEPLRILVNKIKEKRLLAGVHICGNIKPIINFLDKLNADILSLEDIFVTTKTIKMGGVATQTIQYGTKRKIKKEVEEALKHSPIIIATSCDVPPTTPSENIKEMIKYARQ
ncbi:MAG: hypothetical protein N2201_05915 [candidate division WOR-3 bacterium]|nr:hypothetical protein [candidate division WOR-3 bacterium]